MNIGRVYTMKLFSVYGERGGQLRGQGIAIFQEEVAKGMTEAADKMH